MRRRLLPLLALLPAPLGAAMAPAMPEPPLPDRMVLASDTEAQWVSFDLTPGNQIRFNPSGTTWIQLVPTTATLTYQ